MGAPNGLFSTLLMVCFYMFVSFLVSFWCVRFCFIGIFVYFGSLGFFSFICFPSLSDVQPGVCYSSGFCFGLLYFL